MARRGEPDVKHSFRKKRLFFRHHEEGDDRSVLVRNRRLAYIIAGTHQVGFLTPIWVFFGTDHLKLTLTAAVILGSTSWATSSIFEVPLGAFADKFGRQISVVTGLAFCAIGNLALITFHNFTILMLFQVLAGAGYALRSGSLEGLLHDTYEAHGEKFGYSKLSARMLVLLNVSRVITIPIGGFLYALAPHAQLSSYTYPYIATIGCYAVALVCASLLVEHRSGHIYPDGNRGISSRIFGHVGDTFNRMWADGDVKRLVVLVTCFAILDEGNYALYQGYFRERGVDLSYSTTIYTALFILSAIGVAIAPRIYARINVLWTFIVILLIGSIDIALMHLPVVAAVPAFLLNAFISMMPLYLYDNAIQNRMEGNHKTTALSIASMGYTIGAIIGVYLFDPLNGHFGVLKTQWFFVAFGLIATAFAALWCIRESWTAKAQDKAAVMDMGPDITAEHLIPIDQTPQLKP
jgi:MFS family permease